VARNPKDNAVSFYHFHRMTRFLGLQHNMTWNEFFALYMAGTCKLLQSYFYTSISSVLRILVRARSWLLAFCEEQRKDDVCEVRGLEEGFEEICRLYCRVFGHEVGARVDGQGE
jgi:hypothetical protein